MSKIATILISNLPSNTKLALLEIRDRIENLRSSSDSYSFSEAAQIIAVVDAWTKKYGIEAGWKMPTFASNNYADKVDALVSAIASYERAVQVETAISETERILDLEENIRKKETFGIAVLSSDDKEKIRGHIEIIRSLIAASELPERKRVAFLRRLSELEIELDTLGTRTDRFFAFLGDAAFIVGDMTVKARPFIKEVKDILKIVMQGREDAEGVRLPGKFDDILLPPPEE